MKETIKKGLALGIGLAVTTKEQAEKLVEELVKKGEMSQQESKEFLNDLWKKGEDTQREIDEKIKKKAKEMIGELNLATKEEVRELERRIQVLENKQNDS